MKKKILVVCIGVIVLLVIGLYQMVNKGNSVVLSNENSNQIMTSNAITMMYETEAGSGEYQVSNDTTWPSEGYTFNATLSACENGSTLTWNDETKTIQLQANVSDKCYVYFDVYAAYHEICSDNTLACYIAKLYTSDEDGSNIYYHDDEGTYTNATYEAGDYSYRYSGASATVKNYVCFGSTAGTCPDDYLYRIIGVFKVGNVYQVKLIKYDYVTVDQLGDDGDYYGAYRPEYDNSNYLGDNFNNLAVYYLNSTSNIWSEVELNTVNLNYNFLNYIGNTWSSLIANHTWQVGGAINDNVMRANAQTAYNYEVGSLSSGTTYEAKIGLMYVSDYYYAASPTYWTYRGISGTNGYNAATDDNWMYMGLWEWTITRYSTDTNFSYCVYEEGWVGGCHGLTIAVRPSFYLVSTVQYISGDGTYSNPFRIA